MIFGNVADDSTLGGMNVARREFSVGEVYYSLQWRKSKGEVPLISTFEYKGTADGKPHMHVFVTTSLSGDHVFLEGQQLGMMMTFDQLKHALKLTDHAS
jgi:hypothetical protein